MVQVGMQRLYGRKYHLRKTVTVVLFFTVFFLLTLVMVQLDLQ